MRSASVVLLAVLALGCEPGLPPDGSYYDTHIGPILRQSCAQTTSGCHLPDARGAAPGNLDVSSYDALRRRSDVLVPYGPYPRPLLLLKIDEPREISVDTTDGSVVVQTDIRHAGGVVIPSGTRAFAELQSWLANGFTRTGAPAETTIDTTGDCVSGAGSASGFSADEAPANTALYQRFTAEVQPVLAASCASSACHGAELADFHLACGSDEAELRWNYWSAVQQLADPADRSELVRRPLAISRGGAFHGGGEIFADPEDPGYRALLGWAQDVATSAPELLRDGEETAGYRFFVDRVQPTLVRKGCMMLACHSPVSTAFNLRGGAQGSFSRYARRRNYELARSLLAIESPSFEESRIVAKNLYPAVMVEGGVGIVHRGGSLFEDFGSARATPAECDAFDAELDDLNDVPAYCVLARWHRIERDDAIARGEVETDAQPVRAVVWISRPPGVGTATSGFDAYQPGADLRIADATVLDSAVSLGASRSLLAGCALDPGTADLRTPAPSWDGAWIAFAARNGAGAPLRLWQVRPDGTECAPIAGVAPSIDGADGVLAHDFDPAFAPDGRLVFASTRGLSHGRPTRTRASLAPNADLYVRELDGSIRQLTFLLDQELAPAFMQNGRVIYTVEKRELDFHMLALRRQNLDGGDYHPLYASRTSLGFEAAHEVEQLVDQDFVFIASPLDAPDGAGSVVVFNRSIGPDQLGRDGERSYLRSMRMILPSAHHEGRGLFRSPWPLPTGRVLLACAPDASGAPIDFDLCELDPNSGALRTIGGDAGVSEAEVIAIHRRLNRGVLRSDGAGIDHPLIVPDATDAEVHFNDFPMIQTLMFRNTREGRPLDYRIGGFEVYAHRPPPSGASSLADLGANVVTDAYGSFYAERELLGWVPLFADGSARMRVPGGLALSFSVTDAAGAPLDMMEDMPFTGPAMQREHEQYYPGERVQRSIGRRFFNHACGGCHGSISGRELDVNVTLDVISGASANIARDAAPVDLMP